MSKRKPTNRRPRDRQLPLPLKPQGKRHKPDRSARGIVKGKPETFPPGTAMGASGYPVYSLVLRKPHPRAARAIEKEMATWNAIRERQEAAEAAAKLIQLDQPLAGDSLDVKWAKGLLDFLPDDMRREIDRHVAKLTDEQVGWMDGFDDHWQEHQKVRAIIAMGVEFGFAVALARFREPLTAHAPQARELIKRLDDNRKKGTGTTRAKPMKARALLRKLIANATSEGREVTKEEVMKALKCSRTTAWRRMTEIELEPQQ